MFSDAVGGGVVAPLVPARKGDALEILAAA
jgi:hypothetical protein